MPKITPRGPGPLRERESVSKNVETASVSLPQPATPGLFAKDKLEKSVSGTAPKMPSPLSPPVPGELAGPAARVKNQNQIDSGTVTGFVDELPKSELPDLEQLRASWVSLLNGTKVTEAVKHKLDSQFEILENRHENAVEKSGLHGAKVSRLEKLVSSDDPIAQLKGQSEAGEVTESALRLKAEVDGIRLEVKELQEQIHTAGEKPKRAKLSSEARKLLDSLGEIPEMPDDHNQAYASFVSEFGQADADKHHLDRSIENIRHNVEVLRGNGENLESQLDNLATMLEGSSSKRSLKRARKHIEYLKPHFDGHRKQIEGFGQEVDKFVSFIDSLRENKGAAKLKRQQTSEKKAEMLTELKTYLALDYDASDFKDAFAEVRDSISPEVLDKSGVEKNYGVMLHNLGNVQNSLHGVRNFAQMLHDDISKADHMGWLDARVGNLQELKTQFQDYEAIRTGFESQAADFQKQVEGLAQKSLGAPFSSQVQATKERLADAPGELGVQDEMTQQYENSVTGFPGHRDAPQWKKSVAGLQGEMASIRASSQVLEQTRQAIGQEVEGAKTPADLKRARKKIGTYTTLVRAHNSEVRTYQRRAQRFLKTLPGNTRMGVPSAPEKLELTSSGKTLLKYVEKKDGSLFDVLNISRLSYSDGRVLKFSAEDRVAVWQALSEKNPDLSVNDTNKSGNALLHNVVLSASLDETEKITMIEALVGMGADVNLLDREGHPAVETALRLTNVETGVIEILRSHGAHVSDARRIPAIAHMLGAGGDLKVQDGAKLRSISLEGLAPTFAAFGLDPAFQDSIREVESRSSGELKEILHSVERGWVDTQSYSKFITRIQDAKVGIDSNAGSPEILMTGWDHPNGHAVGFVFNQEGGKHYFYACNSGDAKDPHRSIVKYEVKNFDKLIKFLHGCDRNRDQTRSLFVGKPARQGLGRCHDVQQLPDAIDRSSQKRGNCTMASRKSCLLAMMWSEGIVLGVEPKVVKKHYKEVTTELRERGVRAAIDTGHLGLMGKALVKMLTKFDRQECQGYAYEVADAIVRQKKTGTTKMGPGQTLDIPGADSSIFMTTLKEAIAISKASLDERDRSGRTLLEHAKYKNNDAAAGVLAQL